MCVFARMNDYRPIHNPGQIDRAIKLQLNEIKYDVKFDSWLKARIRNQELKNANPDADSVGYAYSNDKAEDWLIRQIDSAIGEIYSELNWCTVDDGHFETDEILENPTEWGIHFHFSPEWRGSMRALKTFAHNFVVNYVLTKWYIAENLPDAGNYNDLASKAMESLVLEARNEVVELEPWRL